MQTQTTTSPQVPRYSPTASFDSRLLAAGALGIAAFVAAAFLSIAAPQITAATAQAPVYDGAGETQWPKS